jgi:DNA-binding MarR family transcriptional regulator
MTDQPDSAEPKQPLDGHLGYHLRRATAAMQADLAQRVSVHGVTIVEMSALLVIEANPAVTQSQIGRLLGIKTANLAPMTAGLVDRGWVKRDDAVGRSVGLSLTAQGATLAKSLHACIKANEKQLLTRLPVNERRRVIDLLRRIWSDG